MKPSVTTFIAWISQSSLYMSSYECECENRFHVCGFTLIACPFPMYFMLLFNECIFISSCSVYCFKGQWNTVYVEISLILNPGWSNELNNSTIWEKDGWEAEVAGAEPQLERDGGENWREAKSASLQSGSLSSMWYRHIMHCLPHNLLQITVQWLGWIQPPSLLYTCPSLLSCF